MIAPKEMERNTLAKIKKMVAELGVDSYLAAAFTGAFELAEQNIDNDCMGCDADPDGALPLIPSFNPRCPLTLYSLQNRREYFIILQKR